MKKVISILLVLSMCFLLSSSVFATENENDSVQDTITIYFNSGIQSKSNHTTNAFETTDVLNFFLKNGMDYEFYKDWIQKQDMTGLESITFTIIQPEATSVIASNNSVSHRIVYADRNYHYTEKVNQFTSGALMKNVVSEAITLVIGKYSASLASLASIFGITDPDTYFGTNRVQQNKDYYVNDGANRVVSKFVELYTPELGSANWYAWGFAEGDYIRHGVQLYYKGLEVGSKKNIYRQNYTENYYQEANLVNLVKNAYSNGRYYFESADAYAAALDGYALYSRTITESQYLEYDNKITN